MQIRIGFLIGCAATALGFLLMALPLGVNEFSITCYIVAATVAAAATASLFPTSNRIGTLVGFAAAALGSLHLVQLLIGAPLDLTVFVLIAIGFVGIILATAKPSPLTRASILIGAAGGLTYLVHDLAVGYTDQLLADTLLTAGFATLWYSHHVSTNAMSRSQSASG